MALRAVRPEFPAVNVRVAIRAILPHVREHRLDVTFVAFHFFVHPAQRILGAIVVEFRNCPDRPPPRGGMAVLAGNGQRAVRTPGVALLSEKLRGEQNQPKNEQGLRTDLECAQRVLPSRPRANRVAGGVS